MIDCGKIENIKIFNMLFKQPKDGIGDFAMYEIIKKKLKVVFHEQTEGKQKDIKL